MNRRAIQNKLTRLRRGGAPRVLDLFAGCGGLSLGFQASGCKIAAAVEFDPDAARSHGFNFHKGNARHSVPRDITATTPTALCTDLDLGEPAAAFDIVIGGPPCQAFARVGRSKLREVADHPEAFRHDPRARLYIEYLDYVAACAPLAVVLENVPDMLNHGGHNIAEEISEVLESRGYVCGYTLLNSAFYGVPQMRERMFLIALHGALGAAVAFPEPTHWINLPPGYEGTRLVAMKNLEFFGRTHFHSTPRPSGPLPSAVTASEAIGDLPPIDARALLASGNLRRGARRFDAPIPYDRKKHLNSYVKLMRSWQGFPAPSELSDHVIRYLPRDYPLFARLQPGDQYPQAHRMAETMFEEALAQLAEWKTWFRRQVDPADDPDSEGQRITDSLLFRCLLEPGEALTPVPVNRNELRRAPPAWRDDYIAFYPCPQVSYVQVSEWSAPIRLEMFEGNLNSFQEAASLISHCALLLPRYAFPVGLDIVDRFAKVPNWMTRPINTYTTVQALKRALDLGDTRSFDALRRMLCGSGREWLLRPGINR